MVVVEADHRLRCSVTLTTTPGRQQVALASYRVPAGSVLGSVCTGSAAAPPHGDEEAFRDPWPSRVGSDARAFEMHLTHLTPASRALLLSQAGPLP